MGGVTQGSAWAVVAMDRLRSSFDGLAGLLSRRHRRRLAKAILHDVLQSIRHSRMFDNMVLATRDPDVAALGQKEGLFHLSVDGEPGSLAQQAIQVSLNGGGESVGLIRGDLALLEAQDLAFLVGRLSGGPGLVFVPTPGAPGLSIVLARPVKELRGDFETGDLPSWRDEAVRRGLTPEVYGIPAGMRPARPQDLLRVYTAARPSRAKALLKDWELGPKLRTFEGEGP